MNVWDLLLVLIEASIAFAGFAGIIATFQAKVAPSIRRGEIVGVTMILNLGLMVAFFSVFPSLLTLFGASQAFVWGASSAALSFYMAYYVYFIHKKMIRVTKSSTFRRKIMVLQFVSVTIIFMLILNVVGVLFRNEPAPYLAGLVYGLIITGYMFTRLLLRPLWRRVREKDGTA